EKWGADEEVDARRASKFRDFEAAAKVLRTL
ncbi:MAG TPA: ATPase, partial [Afipia sp.]|nr:ATPase [Afipia sp.]